MAKSSKTALQAEAGAASHRQIIDNAQAQMKHADILHQQLVSHAARVDELEGELADERAARLKEQEGWGREKLTMENEHKSAIEKLQAKLDDAQGRLRKIGATVA